jgi:putative aldouronate transport system substrate-binding protein
MTVKSYINFLHEEEAMKRLFLLLVLVILGFSFVFAGGRQGSGGGTAGADRPVTVEWFFGWDWVNLHWDTVNSVFDKYVFDNTNINIEFSSGDTEKLNALIATNSLPDIVTYDAVSGQRLEMENSGLLLPLDDLITQYGVTFQVVPAMKDWYRNKDGKWYCYVSHFYDIEDTKARGGYIDSRTNVARKDIMDQLGIDPATMRTKAGFIAALEKVKAAGITYRGQKVIPYVDVDFDDLARQFGADLEDRNGNLLNIQRQPEYLEALLFLNEIYRRGLSTEEIFTLDGNQMTALFATGQVFATGRLGGDILNAKRSLYNSDNSAFMQSFGPIYGDAHKEPILAPDSTAGWAGTMISKNCKNPRAAIELMAFLTRPEISMSTSVDFGGINGYDMRDGKAYIKPERKIELEKDPAAFNNRYMSMLGVICDWVWAMAVTPEESGNKVLDDEGYAIRTWLDGHYYDSKYFTDTQPEFGSDLAGVSAQIGEYWGQQRPLILLAKSADEARRLYNTAIAEMDKMGMARLDAYRNQRFQENKRRMGLQYAWPRNDPGWEFYGR